MVESSFVLHKDNISLQFLALNGNKSVVCLNKLRAAFMPQYSSMQVCGEVQHYAQNNPVSAGVRRLEM